MSYTITNQCIDRRLPSARSLEDRCFVQCPTKAIQKVDDLLLIDSTLCHDGLGYYRIPQSASICPTNGNCVFEYHSFWEQIEKATSRAYWNSWFIRYN